jgi:hypothetical protein
VEEDKPHKFQWKICLENNNPRPPPPHIPFLPLSFGPFESVEEQEMHVFPQQECAAAYQRQKKRLISEQQRGFSRPFFPPSFPAAAAAVCSERKILTEPRKRRLSGLAQAKEFGYSSRT